ncbi:MAG: hypothetical protein CMK09_05130 [Ponticaulis sp.]|nr:hypothetical protein [Ponticaulis sp.]|tara:strand:- start:3593 stop:4177 length:585 start_codon:yes stop_codon:yes gene_type:complete
MTGLRDAKKAALRQKLYSAALARFRTDGYEASSVADICKDVGVAKGTFFNHFPSKADVLAEWYDAAMQTSEAASLAQNASVTETLIARAVSAVSIARTEPDLWLAKHVYAPVVRSIQTREAAADDRIRALALASLMEARERDEVRADVALEDVAELYVACVTGTIREWLNTGQRSDLDETLTRRISALMAMIHS